MKVDLHMHTTCSDGVYTPQELIRRAAQANIRMLAITDHDTVEAHVSGYTRSQEVEVIRAIEMSSRYGEEDVHILGYDIDVRNQALQSYCRDYSQRRKIRAWRMFQRCLDLGYTLDAQAFEALLAKKGSVGRPHIARLLIEKGYFTEVGEVFHAILHRGAPAYVPYERESIASCIQLIHQAGGMAVLAHPGLIADGLEAVLQYPFDGMEVYHPKQRGHFDTYEKLAYRHHFLMTGGSDYHGTKGRFPENVGGFTVESGQIEAFLQARQRSNA